MKKDYRFDRNILFLIIILVVFVASAIVASISLKSDPLGDALSEDSLVKVLFIVEKDALPISTHILTYYHRSNRAAMFDIPGETGSIYKSLGRVDSIDTVYKEKGVAEYKKEIEGITGIAVPLYLVIKLEDFSRLTDLLGGLDVFIPTPVDIFDGNTRVLLPSGAISLDGDKLLTYVSYENSEDQVDEFAIRKQRIVLAFLKKLNEQSSYIFSKELFKVVEASVKSNVHGNDLKSLLSEISKIDAERLVPQRVTGSIRIIDDKPLLFPFYDGQLLKDIVRQTIAGLTSEVAAAQERIYAIEILNGTTKQDLAQKTSELYQSFGYDIVAIKNASSNNYENTVIIDRIGNPDVLNAIAKVIQCSNFEVVPVEVDFDDFGTEFIVDFSIILGLDFDGRYVR